MSNSNKKLDNPSQLNLFDLIKKQSDNNSFPEGSLNISVEYRHLISQIIRESKYSRYEICSRMSELLGQEITVSMLNSWTAESHEQHRFPGEFENAFCEASGSFKLFEFKARKSKKIYVLPGEEALRSEIQKIDEELKILEEEKNKRLFFLNEINSKL